jgi:hypothetical protein
MDSAITFYDEYLALYPTGRYSEHARKRYGFLQEIKASLSVPKGTTEKDAQPEEDQKPLVESQAETDVIPQESSASGEPEDIGEVSPEQETVEP